MATTPTSASDERKSPDAMSPIGRPLRRSRSTADDEGVPGTRFFLPKAGNNGNPLNLGREFRSEGEARVEALKLGVTYYSVQEWRPVADFAGRNPELKRELVTRSGTG